MTAKPVLLIGALDTEGTEYAYVSAPGRIPRGPDLHRGCRGHAPDPGSRDIDLIPSVVDVAGLNRISKLVLAEGAGAMAGMIAAPPMEQGDDKPVQAITEAAHSVNEDVIVLCHGGPLADPQDARHALSNTTGVAGFYGASSTERIRTELAIRDQVAQFTELRID